MASGILIIALIFFSARGYFLGLPGVIARLLGVFLGYVVAFSFRSDVAELLATRSDSGLHPMLLQVISGAVLFFGTLFLVGLAVTGVFKLLAKLVPPLSGVLSKEATGGRIAGALFNGAIGAAIVLTGLWVYGLTLGKHQPADGLQQFANRFGDTLVAVAGHWIDEEDIDTTTTVTRQRIRIQTHTERGTAEITSASDPEKHVSIERLREVTSGSPGDASKDIQALLQNRQLQELVKDPEVRKQAMQYLQDNPQQVMDALNDPKFRELMEQFNAQ